MAVLLISDHDFEDELLRGRLLEPSGSAEIRVWPEIGDGGEIDVVVTDVPVNRKLRYGDLPALRWVCFLGHGVGDVLNDPELPADVWVSGLDDPDIVAGVTEYVVAAVTRRHMRLDEYADLQRRRQWRRLPVPPAGEVRVAVLGLGRIGSRVARMLRELGFDVVGWSSSAKLIEGVETVHGDDALEGALSQADQIVSVLPETARTRGLLDRRRLERARTGAFVVNVGRGSAIVEQDLLELLASGHIGGACLDVTEMEPLDPESPLWVHPGVTITPHTGGAGGDRYKADVIAASFARVMRGDTPLNLASRDKGY